MEKGKDCKKKALFDAIADRISSSTQMINLPLPARDFTGREKELQVLHDACKSGHRVAVTGLGGIGKTALALKYGNDYKSHYQFIHFMPAGSAQLVIQGLLKLADDLHLGKTDKVEERLNWLKITLSRLEYEYLLIFDGVDEVEAFQEIEKYLPERGHCILLTSRMPEQSRIRGFQIVEMPLFSIEEAVNYLLQATGSNEIENAKLLAEKLGRLPLALTHAVGYIRSRKFTIEQYTKEFDRFHVELFEEKYLNLSKDEKTILTTWKASLDAIEQVHGCLLGKEILSLFAFLAQAPIPLEFIEHWFTIDHPGENELVLTNALRWLGDYSLIDSPHSNAYGIHPLVSKVIDYQMHLSQKQKYLNSVLNVFEQLIKESNEKDLSNGLLLNEFPETWKIIDKILPHIKNVIPIEDTTNNRAIDITLSVSQSNQTLINRQFGFIFSQLSNYYRKRHYFRESLKYALRDLDIKQKDPDISERDIAESYLNIGEAYNGMYKKNKVVDSEKKALEYAKMALEINLNQDQLSGPRTSHNTIKNLRFIWWVYNNMGDHINALQSALKIFKENREIANKEEKVRNHGMLGYTLEYLGRLGNLDSMEYEILQKDLKQLEEYLEIEKLKEDLKRLKECYPSYLPNCDQIILLQWDQSRKNDYLFVLSLGCYLKHLFMVTENSPESLSVAKAFALIGLCLGDLGYYQTAIGFHLKALGIREKYSEMIVDIARTYAHVGWNYAKLENFHKSLEYFKKALNIRQQILGGLAEGDLDIAKNYRDVAYSYEKLQQYTDAVENYKKAIKVGITCLEENVIKVIQLSIQRCEEV